jgi:hypothetical protein
MKHMTKTQQKLEHQAIAFLNCGGKALTALLSMLLLSLAVFFECIGKFFVVLETQIENDARETERAQKSSQVRAITFTANEDRGSLDGAFAHSSAPALTAAAAGRGHHA